jgi:hypothetical protein
LDVMVIPIEAANGGRGGVDELPVNAAKITNYAVREPGPRRARN